MANQDELVHGQMTWRGTDAGGKLPREAAPEGEAANSIIQLFCFLAATHVQFFVDNWILILVAFASGAMLVWPMVGRGGGNSVSPNEAVRLINREKGVLVDVSEPNEFAAGHAVGARNVPLGSLESAKGLPPNKSLPLVLVCPTGARAGRAVTQLRKAGYERAIALAGGTAAWREANLPIEKSAA